jgi:hypothetical protein
MLTKFIECQYYYHEPCVLYVSLQCGLTGSMAEKIQAAHKKSLKLLQPSEKWLSTTTASTTCSKHLTTEPPHPMKEIFSRDISMERTPPTLDDFRIINVIGKGNFGKVSHIKKTYVTD